MKLILPEVELVRLSLSRKIQPERKSYYGQYFTPAPVCEFMASLFNNIKDEVRFLDPGAGIGSLTAAFVDEAIKRSSIKDILIHTFEIDELFKAQILNTLSLCRSRCIDIGLNVNIIPSFSDFILSTTSWVDGTFFEVRHDGFTHILMNPPYKKISTKSEHRKTLSSLGIETVNLYTAFVALAVKLLSKDGELVAIIPRSFCNGPYYKPFRQILINEVAINHIHIFERREKAFRDDNVLQENIIIHCTKGGVQKEVIITSSPSADFHFDKSSGSVTTYDMTQRTVDFKEIVRPSDKLQFIHISPNNHEKRILERLAIFKNSLSELGLEVSTGPVVGFRLKEDLRKSLDLGSVPLLYPVHLKQEIKWPTDSKKPNAIKVSDKSQPWLWPNKGAYVLTRRFSSKEEKRRIIASVYRSEITSELIGFENKLNVFHSGRKGFNEDIAKGLYIYLNSTLLDKYYRLFGGHTQVNATDFRSLKYPSLESLIRMGKRVKRLDLSQSEIDELLDSEIDRIGDISMPNPLKSQHKIDQALDLLKLIGMPKQQSNERSALTLLALIDLKPEGSWSKLSRPMLGVTQIMNWCSEYYGKEYAPNTRETFRRQTLHQFVQSGIVLYNPDDPNRPVNSPKACYQISEKVKNLITVYETDKWDKTLEGFLLKEKTLKFIYAHDRDMVKIPLQIDEKVIVNLTVGKHSELIRSIVEEFGPRFVPGAEVVYLGDTGSKIGYLKEETLISLGIEIDKHGKFPDVILYFAEKNWLILVEAVTSHGPVDSKRHIELADLFKSAKSNLIFVTAFPDRKTMAKYLPDISWETEVWINDDPTHLIHFDGDKYLQPY